MSVYLWFFRQQDGISKNLSVKECFPVHVIFKEKSRMITWQEVRKELLSDPEVQHEYDILKQNEEAKQRRLNRVEKTHSKPSSAPSHSSQPTYA